MNPVDNKEYVYLVGGNTGWDIWTDHNNIDKFAIQICYAKMGAKMLLFIRYDVQADTWTTIGQTPDGNHWWSRGNLRAGNKFYMENQGRQGLAEFDPATETYTVINTV